MIGHGRPSQLARPLARAAIALCAFLVADAAAQNPPPAEPVQLRITWGGGEASRWTGSIATDDGSLSNLNLLGTDADATGSIWLEAGKLRIATLSAHKVDSVEVATQATATAKLQVELAATGQSSAQRLEVPLAEIARRPYQVRLDDRGNTLDIRVVPPPALRITTNRDPLIYLPSEPCSFELSPALANLTPGTELGIQTTLTAARRKEVLWTDNQRLSVPVSGQPKLVLNVPLPNAEGVYTIHVVATRPRGFELKWAASTRLAERTFQVVVLDPRPSASATNAKWESVLEIDPTNPRWVERLPGWTQVRLIPGLNHGAMGNIRIQPVNLPLGRFMELPPATPGADPNWQAYSLPLEAVGVPHMLEIDYPDDSEQHFGISIVEPNAAGVVSGTNRDAGVFVEGLGRTSAQQKQSQRLVFWPRTEAPLLLVTNMHPTANAHFGPIRVLKRNTNQLNDGPSAPIPRERLIAAYLSRPTLAETFGATQTIDPLNSANDLAPECTSDCQTAYESATRFADYLRYSGYNSAVVNIGDLARPKLPALGTLDVDPLEILLRVCDREGISLLPAIDFSSPLAQLETLRRKSDARISGLEWVGPDGRTWLEVYGNRQGLAPYYNLLDPRVQQVLLKLVADLLARYGERPAFAGLAVQLSSDGYAQLPPLEWGLDDVTVARFARDKGIQLADHGENRFANRQALLTGPHAEAWRSWRAAQVTAFYAELASVVRGNSGRRLVLTTENVFTHPQLSARLRPKLQLGKNSENRLATALVDLGIHRQSLERVPGLVLVPTRYVAPTNSLPDRAPELELNEAFAVWCEPSSPQKSRAAVLYHRPLERRLASFEAARVPWRVSGEMRLINQSLPGATAVRQPYAEALAENDPAVIIDGGELLPMGQENDLRDIRATLAQLPVAAEISEAARQPVIVRTYAEPNRITIVAMNMSPWPCDAQVSVDLPQATTLERIAAPKTGEAAPVMPVAVAAGRQLWSTKLAPYEISAVRIPLSGAKVVDVQVVLTAAANAELAAKLADLTTRDLTAESTYQALANPSFEPLGGPAPVPGWHLSSDNAKTTAQLDATHPQDGKTSLYLRSEGRSAVIESDSFLLPPTGQLAMSVFARGPNVAQLRLIIEAECNGQIYHRATRINAAVQHPNGQWDRPAIIVNDLPLQSRGQVRVAFELIGPGEVWLDNVKLHDVLFATNFYDNAKAEVIALYQQIHAAQSAFDAGQISDCLRIVDGYWPRFVLANRPRLQPKIAALPAPNNQQPSPAQPNQGQDTAPGVRDRVKRLLPSFR